MVTTVLAAILVAQSAQPSPSALLTNCIARYMNANTVAGTVTMTQSARGKSVVTETEIQTQKPTKVRLKQTQKGGDNGQCLLTSDGVYFSYDPIPSNVLRFARSVEPLQGVKNPAGKPFGLSDIFLAMNDRLVDRNPWIEMIFGEIVGLKVMKAQWATLLYRGRVKVRGMDVHAISGDWRETASAKHSAEYEIYLNDDNDLVRYVTKQHISVQGISDVIDVTTIWDADIKVDGPVDQSLFKVVR